MKKGLLRVAGIASIVLLPALVLAEGGLNNEQGTKAGVTEQAAVTIYDDAFAGRRQDKKRSRPKKDDTRQDKPADKKPKIKDGKKPAVKEVPKSIPKLKPKAVTDKIKIKRPVKVKPKGLLRVL
ncbi:MAG TPA: hypothetical protein VGE26_06640 [Sphingobacteriaceae bacterium]